jgi:hypothetical protein
LLGERAISPRDCREGLASEPDNLVFQLPHARSPVNPCRATRTRPPRTGSESRSG